MRFTVNRIVGIDASKLGAERFGWFARNSEPRSMRKMGQLVRYGMARGALGVYQPHAKPSQRYGEREQPLCAAGIVALS